MNSNCTRALGHKFSEGVWCGVKVYLCYGVTLQRMRVHTMHVKGFGFYEAILGRGMGTLVLFIFTLLLDVVAKV